MSELLVIFTSGSLVKKSVLTETNSITRKSKIRSNKIKIENLGTKKSDVLKAFFERAYFDDNEMKALGVNS